MNTNNFDFTKPKVRRNGKVLDKFEVCWYIKQLNYWKGLYAYDVYSYKECKELLKKLVNENYGKTTQD